MVDGKVILDWLEVEFRQIVYPKILVSKAEAAGKLSWELFSRVDDLHVWEAPGTAYERKLGRTAAMDLVVVVAGTRDFVWAVISSELLPEAYRYAGVEAGEAWVEALKDPNEIRCPSRPCAMDEGYRPGKLMHQKQEERVARKLDGNVQRGSGNQPHRRGDVRACEEDVWAELLVECKTTEARSIRVEAKWLEKITREALAQGKEPALNIEIQKMDLMTPRDWTMVPTELLVELLRRVK